ncbi:MAG: protein kinase [Actinomycetota bacterium]|nr:protein kinase [Actinomycetota bacterium]
MGNATKTLAGRYILDELLAQGGMASVWSGRDEVLARRVAIKILHPHLARDDTFLARFKREAMAAARLAHPHIVSIFDTGEEPGEDGARDHYIVMEYCGGGSLHDLLRRERALAPATVTTFGTAVCDALHYAHSNDVIHRDVKPGNVLLGSDRTVKVADFGIAKAAVGADDISTTGTLLGTVAYISPEQANGAEPDERSDIYSTGILLYELVTGRPPFSGDSHVATALMHVKQPPRPPRSVRAGIPRALDEVVMTALAKDPDDRFASAAEMRSALERSGGETPTPSRAAVAASPSASGTSLLAESRWLVPVVALIAGVVVIAALLTAIFSESPLRNITGGGEPQTGRLQIVESTSFDPEGDDRDEHSEDAHLAHDGNATTTWPTQTYGASLQTLGKSGVGLLFDLGSEQTVARVEISSPLGGYDVEIRSAQAPPSSVEDTELVGQLDDAGNSATIPFESAVARYWIVWITSLPGGGAGKAEISEVSFFGS